MTLAILLTLAAVVWTGLNLYVTGYGSGPLLRLSNRSPAVPRAILARQDGHNRRKRLRDEVLKIGRRRLLAGCRLLAARECACTSELSERFTRSHRTPNAGRG